MTVEWLYWMPFALQNASILSRTATGSSCRSHLSCHVPASSGGPRAPSPLAVVTQFGLYIHAVLFGHLELKMPKQHSVDV